MCAKRKRIKLAKTIQSTFPKHEKVKMVILQNPNLHFSDSILTLSDRLAGPFNAENVILPLDVSISEAIMNFQESGFKVSDFIMVYLELNRYYYLSVRTN